MKKKFILFILLICTLYSFVLLCKNINFFSKKINNNFYIASNINLEVNGTYNYSGVSYNTDNTFNKYAIKYSSNIYLKGEITYRNNKEGVYTERFFLEPTNGVTKDFYSYIDGGMEISGTARYGNKNSITSIKFTNIDNKSGSFNISSFKTLLGPNMSQTTNASSYSLNESYVNQGTYVIANDNIKLGVSLKWGGGINYIIGNNNIFSSDLKLKNLVNRYDSGRLIQQAYYQDKYYKGNLYNNDSNIEYRYNPVQGGNESIGTHSKIVDIGVSGNEMVIITKPALWAIDNSNYKSDYADLYGGVLADAYMYTKYILHDKYIEVQNKYTDFSINATGAMIDSSLPVQQEEPAVYLINSLSKFVSGNYKNGYEEKAYGSGVGPSSGQASWGDFAGYFNANNEGIGFYRPNYNGSREYFSYWKTSTNNNVSSDPSSDNNVKYLALIRHSKIEKNKPEEYTYIITLGNKNSIDNIITNYKMTKGYDLNNINNGGIYEGSTKPVVKSSPQLVYNTDAWYSIGSATRSNYTLTGYYLAASGGTKIYEANGFAINGNGYWSNNKYQKEEPLTIYAQWTPTNYSITYTLNGGTVSGNPTSYNVETNAFTLKNPTKSGYKFIGWSGTGINGKSTSVTITKGSSGNRTYTANFELLPLKISNYTIKDKYIYGINLNTDASKINLGLNTGYTYKVYDKNNDIKTSGKMATGDTIKIYAGSNLHVSYRVVIKGDVTGSGTSTVGDVAKLYQYLKGKIKMDDVYINAGNVVSTDDIIKINDVAKLYQYIKGKISNLD